ncbi:MAG: asparaginase domain-containing protein, partial [archaeon]
MSESLKAWMKKHSLKEGNLVDLNFGNEKVEGFLLPSSSNDSLTLKLINGYNIGVKLKDVKKVEKKGEGIKPGKPEVRKIEFNKNLPLIGLIHTGGTIAARVDYETGAVIYSGFNPEDLINLFPEITETANIKVRFLSGVASDDLNFKHYQLMTKTIIEEIKKEKELKGIILTHGTDTMHYTSSALSFMLEGLNIPVILTGSQRSSDRGSSYAAMNLVCAAE